MAERPAYPLCLLSIVYLSTVACGETVDEPDRPPGTRPGHVEITTNEPDDDIVAAANCRAVEIARSVEVGSESYSPTETTIEKGSVVRWTNRRDSPVTVTSGDEGQSGTVFDSGEIAPRQSFCFEFKMAGRFHYYSRPHGSDHLSGRLRVEPTWR